MVMLDAVSKGFPFGGRVASPDRSDAEETGHFDAADET
jgi:hypothetical protein